MFGWLKKISPAPSYGHPDAQWFAEASGENIYTPDIWVLRRYHFQLLFVYGTQMQGHPQHELINDYGAYAATAYTDGQFTLWKKRLGRESYPVALEGSEYLPDGHKASGYRCPEWALPPHTRVQGEIYAIKTQQLINLDKHYQNTLEFKRKRVPLLIPYRKLHKIDTQGEPGGIQEFINQQFDIHDKVVTTENAIKTIRAWMYIGISEYWTSQSNHLFSPVQVYTPRLGWLGDYYAFTRAEYDK